MSYVKPPTRTITIVMTDSNHFDVFEGERYCDRLGWDEMLGQIAAMTIPTKDNRERGLYGMLTPEEHEEKRARWAAIAERSRAKAEGVPF